MAEIANKNVLADTAKGMANGFNLVQRGATTYIPVHWQTGQYDPVPEPEETIWIPFTRESKMRLANVRSSVLFATDAEFRSFDFMLRQVARHDEGLRPGILVRTHEGLRVLDEHGKLVQHTGEFMPNFVGPILNEDPLDKEFVYSVITDWLGGHETETESLLKHLATSLAPHYSAVKYILFLGGGRNGKSVLLMMLSKLYGEANISNVTRQAMSNASPVCVELNNKLLNIVFDGEMTYLKDSSMEKTFTAGEPAWIRMLYESATTKVQTNALFLEALNTEPKSRDKSSALQKRLARFRFPNTYKVDKAFSNKMTSERYLGALLSLLIDRYVPESGVGDQLALTQASKELQFEQVFIGSPVLQYISHLDQVNPDAVDELIAGQMKVDDFLASFKPWMEAQGFEERSDAEAVQLLKQSFIIGSKTFRSTPPGGGPKRPTSKRVIKELKADVYDAIEIMRAVPDEEEETDEAGDQ